LLIVFIFSFTACTISKSATETTAPEATTKSKIAFASDRDGNFEIYIMNMDGSGAGKTYKKPGT